MTGPLDSVFVLDFSTLLPGPLATLMLAEAGAEVLKIERPGDGENMRSYLPMWGGESLNFATLNRGKKSLALDLKSPEAKKVLTPLIERADVLVEQFRPGVMERLGLGYPVVAEINPRIIYCSITGYGQTGPKRLAAGHDLNYVGDAGLLSISSGPPDRPVLPPCLIADVGGGSYPAILNILLALRDRDRTGKGAHLDIAMSEGVFAFAYWAFAQAAALGQPLVHNGERLTGGSPRYRLYPTADGRAIAVGALEQKFWDTFCNAIDLDAPLRDDTRDPEATGAAVARIISSRSAKEWEPVFGKHDCCATVVRTLDEVTDDPQFTARGVFGQTIRNAGGETLPALPLPIVPTFRAHDEHPVAAPVLGEHNFKYGSGSQASDE